MNLYTPQYIAHELGALAPTVYSWIKNDAEKKWDHAPTPEPFAWVHANGDEDYSPARPVWDEAGLSAWRVWYEIYKVNKYSNRKGSND